jgi:hypothetical protein
VAFGRRRHGARAFPSSEADHASLRRGPQMRRQHHVGMSGRNGGVIDRAEEGASVGHGGALVSEFAGDLAAGEVAQPLPSASSDKV